MRAIDVVRALAPNSKAQYLDAFERVGDDLARQFVLTTDLRLIHFLARALQETDGFTILVESANYSAAGLAKRWDAGDGRKAFATKAEMMSMAGQPEELFNRWYGNRMGNGPASTGDGYRYRGRGPLQTTGREAYASAGKRLGIDLVGNPDLLLDARYILLPALYEWQDAGCNIYADRDDGLSIGRIINIGTANTSREPNGWDDQKIWIGRVKVAIAQMRLNALGASLTVDGWLGTKSAGALRDFQARKGLKVTGRADVSTLAALAARPAAA